jgi:hypothetical protein
MHTLAQAVRARLARSPNRSAIAIMDLSETKRQPAARYQPRPPLPAAPQQHLSG